MRLLVSKPIQGKVTVLLLGGPNGRQVKDILQDVPKKDVQPQVAEMLARHGYLPQPRLL